MLRDKIQSELITALKSKNMDRAATLRLMVAALNAREKELFAKNQTGPLADAEVLQVLQKEAKKRQESIDAFRAGNRADLVDKETAELNIVREFLPAPLSAAELETIMNEIISTHPADFGSAMRAVMERANGRAEGRAVSELLKAKMQ